MISSTSKSERITSGSRTLGSPQVANSLATACKPPPARVRASSSEHFATSASSADGCPKQRLPFFSGAGGSPSSAATVLTNGCKDAAARAPATALANQRGRDSGTNNIGTAKRAAAWVAQEHAPEARRVEIQAAGGRPRRHKVRRAAWPIMGDGRGRARAGREVRYELESN